MREVREAEWPPETETARFKDILDMWRDSVRIRLELEMEKVDEAFERSALFLSLPTPTVTPTLANGKINSKT